MTLEELNKLSVIELKALAYDEVCKLDLTKKNLSVLEQIIVSKNQPNARQTKK